jgi:hypothetical protein
MPLSRNDFNNIDLKTFNYEKFIETIKTEEDAMSFNICSDLINISVRHCACGGEMSFIKKKSKKIGYIFRCKTCKKETSPPKNTFFENCKLKIRNVLKIIYMYCSNYKVTQIMHELGIKMDIALLIVKPNYVKYAHLLR